MLDRLVTLGEKLLLSVQEFFDVLFMDINELLEYYNLDVPHISWLEDVTLVWLVVGMLGVYFAYALVKWIVDFVT